MKLDVPHYQQNYSYTCLPACVAMVLDYWGEPYTEGELADTFATVPFLGTLPENVVSGLESMGYHALWFEGATIERLRRLLDQTWPVIVFLRAANLPHGTAGLHAVVVVEITAKHITCRDPGLTHELALELTGFLEAWSPLGQQGIVIWM
jgi:ABC-type bacteriocin/lantibiotic exporter with double-glycine peptidase domain